MNILFLTQVLPYPLDAGPKVRAYYVLRHLAQRHPVTLVSFVRPTDTPAAVAHLRSFCQAVHTVPMPRSRARDAVHLLRSLVTGQPFMIARDWVPVMARLLRELTTDTSYGTIHADQLWMAPYALQAQAPAAGGRRPALILDQHNAVHLIPRRLAQGEGHPVKRLLLEREARVMARYEVAACRRFDTVVWVTEEDRRAVAAAADSVSRSPHSALGVRHSAFAGPVIPICGDAQATAVIPRCPGGRRVTFLGGLHWPPNAQGLLWFARRVFPLVLRACPDAVLTVIGRDAPAAVLSAGLPDASLDVTGYVADPTPYLRETAAFVVPLLAGGGMRVKIIDAWLWGLPVVSTTIGAEGIAIRQGENIVIADSPEAFAQATVRLLQDPAEGQRLGQAGRLWAEEHYNWRVTYKLWDSVYPADRAWTGTETGGGPA